MQKHGQTPIHKITYEILQISRPAPKSTHKPFVFIVSQTVFQRWCQENAGLGRILRDSLLENTRERGECTSSIELDACCCSFFGLSGTLLARPLVPVHSASSSTSLVLTFIPPRLSVPDSHHFEQTKYRILRVTAKHSFSRYLFQHKLVVDMTIVFSSTHSHDLWTLSPSTHTCTQLTRLSHQLWTENGLGGLCLLPPGPSLGSVRGGTQCDCQGPPTLYSSPVVLLC